jgi:magnesium-transporting ATPase (P-type)
MTENLAVLEPVPATDKNTGLSQEQAEQRLKADGPNELSKGAAINPWSLLFDQFKSSVVILLLVATDSLLCHERVFANSGHSCRPGN